MSKNETVVLELETFKRMDDIVRGRDKELEKIKAENDELIRCKNLITFYRGGFGRRDQYTIKNDKEISEILGRSFKQIETEKTGFELQVKNLEEKLKQVTYTKDRLEKQLKDFKSKLIYRIFYK